MDFSNYYFARNSFWNSYNDAQIILFGIDKKQKIVLDNWQTMVFHFANGSTRYADVLIELLKKTIETDRPEFSRKMAEAMNYLVDSHTIIVSAEAKIQLPYYFNYPIDEQEEDFTDELLKRDGLLPD